MKGKKKKRTLEEKKIIRNTKSGIWLKTHPESQSSRKYRHSISVISFSSELNVVPHVTLPVMPLLSRPAFSTLVMSLSQF